MTRELMTRFAADVFLVQGIGGLSRNGRDARELQALHPTSIHRHCTSMNIFCNHERPRQNDNFRSFGISGSARRASRDPVASLWEASGRPLNRSGPSGSQLGPSWVPGPGNNQGLGCIIGADSVMEAALRVGNRVKTLYKISVKPTSMRTREQPVQMRSKEL